MKKDATEIKAQRSALGLSQFKLAIKARVSRHKLSLAECGYTKLSVKEVGRLLKAINYFHKCQSRISKCITQRKIYY